jgi:hypothetical protein
MAPRPDFTIEDSSLQSPLDEMSSTIFGSSG